MFNANDRQQLADLGIKESVVLQQISNFKEGFPFSSLLKPAVVGDGLISLSSAEAEKMASLYDANTGKLDVLKFVPASGAATRMFKDNYSFWNELNAGVSPEVLFNKYPDVKHFFENLEKFPFHEDLDRISGNSLKNLLQNKEYATILEFFVDEKGLNIVQQVTEANYLGP